MNTTTLVGTDICTSRIGFGCGSLMRLPSPTARQRILDMAYDIGIRHFDVARMYGLGKAEQELGKFLRGKRDKVVVVTKFGISANNLVERVGFLQPLARAVVKAFPWVRNILRQQATRLYEERQYTVETAKKSLDRSLQELGTDYVDIFFLHEPSLDELQNSEVQDFLEEAKHKGLIRAYGVAGNIDKTLLIVNDFPALTPILQINNDALEQQISCLDNTIERAIITFSPFSNALAVIRDKLKLASYLRKSWSDLTGYDFSKESTIALFLMAYALGSNPRGVVLFSTTSPSKLKEAAKWADDNSLPSKHSMDIFLDLIQKDLSLPKKPIMTKTGVK